ncbi:MAG: 30S ribosomal protein S6 [Patescibacteria group bacterium]
MDSDDKQKIYELAFLANPSLPEEELLALVEKVRNWAKETGCEIIKEGAMQKRKLGYSVGKFQSAFLISLLMKGPSSAPEILDKKIIVENSILRHLFVNYTQKELDQLEQGRTIRTRREPVLSSAQTTITSSAPTKEATPKEEAMDKESLKEIDKRLEEILGKNI